MVQNPNWTRDEIILALDLYYQMNPLHASQKSLEVIELSKLLNSLPIHAKEGRGPDFRNPDGVYMKMCNFLSLDPSYEGKGLEAASKLDQEVWDEFSEDRSRLHQIAEAIRNNYIYIDSSLDSDINGQDEEFSEGNILARLHRKRERNQTVVNKKKKSVMESTGCLACEVCGFDFYRFYGELGEDFAECHHNRPLSDFAEEQRTKISDLSIVCANCHRMLHRSKPPKTLEELQEIIQKP